MKPDLKSLFTSLLFAVPIWDVAYASKVDSPCPTSKMSLTRINDSLYRLSACESESNFRPHFEPTGEGIKWTSIHGDQLKIYPTFYSLFLKAGQQLYFTKAGQLIECAAPSSRLPSTTCSRLERQPTYSRPPESSTLGTPEER